MATTRKAISKKTRFEVFKRDGFKCMYCGASAPEVVLNVDHINPVAKGGKNDLLNLISSCVDCNSGKSDRLISDESAIAKQRVQLDELSERREQMEMMLKWRNAMKDIKDQQICRIQECFNAAIPGWNLTSDEAMKTVRDYLRKYSFTAIMDAIELAADRYTTKTKEGKVTQEQALNAWKKVGGILHIGTMSDDMQRIRYVRGILKNRLNYIPVDILTVLENAYSKGVSVESMDRESRHTRTWTSFRQWLDANIEAQPA